MITDASRRDCSYFKSMSKEEAVALLAKHEKENTLSRFLREKAPDYVGQGGYPNVFTLMKDMGW